MAIIAHTVKGKGVTFMEDDNNWHYKIPSKEEVEASLVELGFPRTMRNAFAKAMEEITASQDDVVLLSGDIGNRMFDKLKKDTPAIYKLRAVCRANNDWNSSGLSPEWIKTGGLHHRTLHDLSLL